VKKLITVFGACVGVLILSGFSELYDYGASEELASSSRKAKRVEDIKTIWCYYTADQRGLSPLVDYTTRKPTAVIDDHHNISSFMAALGKYEEMPSGIQVLHPGGIAIVMFFKSGGKPAYFHCYLWSQSVMVTPLLDPDVATMPTFAFYQYILKNYPQLAGLK